MTLGEREQIEAWVCKWLLPSKSARRISSYYLKHVFEADGGFYVTDEEFKLVLTLSGMSLLPSGEVRVKWNRGCKGRTARGETCLMSAKMGEDFCGLHINERCGGYHRRIV